MAKITWYLNRLRAVNFIEVGWRIQQKILQMLERNKYGANLVPVGSLAFECNLEKLK